MRSHLRTAGIALASALFLGLSSSAHAGDYLIDPTGGTNLTPFFAATVPDPTGSIALDDGSAARSLGFSFSLFNNTRTGINVCTNGFIQFRAIGQGANTSPANAALPTSGGIQRIAGLWDDFYIEPRTGDSVLESKGTNYYAVTYLVHKVPMGGDIQFQIALFGGNVTVGGYDFKANDIAFSYHKMVGPPVGGTATVGLDAGDGTNFTTPPDFPDGLVDAYSKLALFSTSGSGLGSQGLGPQNGFYKFSQNGSGGYDATIVPTGGGTPSAAPEPGTLALLGLGVSLMGGIAFRRRK